MYRGPLLATFLAIGFGMTGAADELATNQASPDQAINDFTLEDYMGAKYSLADWSEKKAIVVVFLGTECPLAKLYGSRLAEMSARYADEGVQFVGRRK
jgi:hypothetical protein